MSRGRGRRRLVPLVDASAFGGEGGLDHPAPEPWALAPKPSPAAQNEPPAISSCGASSRGHVTLGTVQLGHACGGLSLNRRGPLGRPAPRSPAIARAARYNRAPEAPSKHRAVRPRTTRPPAAHAPRFATAGRSRAPAWRSCSPRVFTYAGRAGRVALSGIELPPVDVALAEVPPCIDSPHEGHCGSEPGRKAGRDAGSWPGRRLGCPACADRSSCSAVPLPRALPPREDALIESAATIRNFRLGEPAGGSPPLRPAGRSVVMRCDIQ
jgi:hypothetical protein